MESLLDDIDFKVLVERATFELISKHLVERIQLPIERVLAQAQKQISDIDAIEIIGGGVRIPMVQSRLTEYFQGKEIGAHLNGDEAMALGAVFQAANYSNIFRVRPIWLYDGNGEKVRVVVKLLENGEILEEKEVFEESDYFGKKSSLEIEQNKNLQLVFERKRKNAENYEIFKIYNFSNIENIYQVYF